MGIAVLMILMLVTLIMVYQSVQQVPQGYSYTVEYLGRYTKTLSPGVYFIIPFIERIGAKINMREQVLDISPQRVALLDNTIVTIDAVCFYQVIQAEQAAYEVSDLEYALRHLVIANIYTVIGSMTLDAILSQRDQINAQLLAIFDQATDHWGVKVTRVDIKGIMP